MNIKVIEDREYIRSILNLYPFYLDSNIKDGCISVQSAYAGEVRMGPPFYLVAVLNNQKEIFKDAIYGGEIFCHNILSKKYNRLILVKWFSEVNPYEQVISSIDLISGKEFFLTGKDRYFNAGHFDSFDGIFYSKPGTTDTFCKNLETNETFMLEETLNKDINHFFSWGLSPLKDTITVITKEKKNNVIIYNLKNKKIESACTMDFDISENGKISCFLDKENDMVLIELSDYRLKANRRIVNERKDYKILKF
ncbi:hypothetical protein MKJ01_09310 [Chryseobacterium sp. SSA4.19]|uniref:hypothetical protein n=1 Tax=Chryseobacterium sp. SSA4.19 TaxID=2919915 RepID=UPI001F4EDDB7|nr:hypothetical protein [Chryseobacterium sp. SSA4.19]MCJ8153953.1 hypothetical protein [Chryseobacterium sp. SSA4.19]